MTSRTYRALLIANSTFPNDAANLPDLEGPRNDPVVLRDALCDDEAGLFSADNVRLVTERTMSEVLGEVDDFLRSATRQDTVLLYYSGHGLLDLNGELYLCTRDTRAEGLRSTAVNAHTLRAMMDDSAAAATVVVVDCCHSGRFKGGSAATAVPSALSGQGRFILTSTRASQLAHDAHVRNHASLFTHHLAEGLVRGAEDRDGDGLVTLSGLYDYVHAALVDEGRQVPQKHFSGDGDVAVALRTPRPDARPAVPDLVDPALAPPILDLSESAIDLEVDLDEDLPPEHIAVINRGGGSLEWTVESSAPWVSAVADGTSVVLHLDPAPGPNRANVYIRDAVTGAMKTIRISVRARERPTAESAEPVVAWPEVEAAGPGRTAEPEAGDAVRWFGLGSVVLGLLIAASGDEIAGSNPDHSLWLRGEDWGAGIQPSVLGGLALLLLGLVAAARSRWWWPIGASLGLALPLGFLRLAEGSAFERIADGVVYFQYSGALAVVVGVAALLTLRQVGWQPTAWAPPALVHCSLVAAIAWAASLVIDPYYQDLLGGSHYGGAFSGGSYGDAGMAGVWRLAGALTVVGLLYGGFRRLARPIGQGVVLGAVAVPLLGVVHEIAYLVASDEHPDGARLLALTLTPAVLLAVLVVSAVAAPSEADAGSLGATLRSTGRMVRRHPRRAAGAGGVTVALVVAGTLLLPAGQFGEQARILDTEGSSPTLNRSAFSPDGDRLAFTTSFAELWDPAAGRQETTVGSGDSARAVAFLPGSEVVVISDRDAGVEVIDLSTDDPVEPSPLPGYGGADDEAHDFVEDIEISVERGVAALLVASTEGGPSAVDLWDLPNGEAIGSLPLWADGTTLMALSEDGRTLATAGSSSPSSAVQVWDVDTQRRNGTFALSGNSAGGLAFSPDGDTLAVTSDTGIEILDLASGQADRVIPVAHVGSSPVAYSPGGDLLAAADGQDIVLWDAATSTDQPVGELEGHDRELIGLAFSPDGTSLASASGDGTVRIWDLGSWAAGGR